MRRSVCIFVGTLTAVFLVASAASAIGPGGWDHVGVGTTPATTSLNGSVSALNTDSPSGLYVGGAFTSAGGNTSAQRIARWSGSKWFSLGTTPLDNGDVRAIAYHAGKVYVGGTFQNAGGNPNADYLAVWNGTVWAPFCNRVSGTGPSITATVQALQIVGNTLYVGGSFANGAGIASADSIVGCDLTTGNATSPLVDSGNITGGAVYALTADSNGRLFAGGAFVNLNGIPAADHLASYDGASWHAVGGTDLAPSVDSLVRSLTAVGTTVYVGSDSVNIDGIAAADHVARWDGSAWSAIGANTAGTDGWFPADSFIYGLSHDGSLVFAAGSFQNANGIATADDVAYFDGSSWRPIGSNGAGNGPLDAQPNAIAVTGGKVYVGGSFVTAGGDNLARALSAYALGQPDVAIAATATATFAGLNVYSSSGAGEVRRATVARGSSVTSYIKIVNRGLEPAVFHLLGTGSATGMTVQYYRGSTDITTAVLAGTWATPTIAAQSSITIRCVVNVATSSAASATFTTTSRSQTGTPTDAVRVVVNATG